ncbi:hypothetical protein FNE43_03475 [Helicobacter pylori]|nr:hypothetical protein FNE43_03475 [Helicobacter pylori]
MKNIYLDVKASIESLQNIFKNTDDRDERLKKSNQEALKVFQKLEFESLKELESLKNNEEWENFTIAFYGETGAGKSTLIEYLRLFFKEQSKVVQQERFKRLYSTYQKNYQNDERNKQAVLNELHSLQDGAIIGDGRSDFTLKTQSYSFQLGEHYMGYKAVSAQAAFYGLSQALIPETDFYEKKQKFLEIFKVEELLYKSHFKPLAEFITEALLKNSRAKIIQSNCNKALKVVEQLQKAIKTTIYRQIDPTIREIKNHHQEVCDNLDRSTEKFISDLEKSAFSKIDQFKSDLREKMYAHIDDDIENDELKTIFKHELQKGTEKLGENIKQRSNECKESFIEEIKKDIEQFEERIKDSLIMLDRINIDSGFDFGFNIDSGINTIGLFASIGGLVLLLATPVLGEFALIGGLVLGAIGIVKSVWSFFDSDYKKSQQRKEMDKNLDKACEKITEDVRNQIESGKKGASEMIENLKASLNDLIVCYERMREGLIKAGEDLWHLDDRIKTTLKNKGTRNE